MKPTADRWKELSQVYRSSAGGYIRLKYDPALRPRNYLGAGSSVWPFERPGDVGSDGWQAAKVAVTDRWAGKVSLQRCRGTMYL